MGGKANKGKAKRKAKRKAKKGKAKKRTPSKIKANKRKPSTRKARKRTQNKRKEKKRKAKNRKAKNRKANKGKSRNRKSKKGKARNRKASQRKNIKIGIKQKQTATVNLTCLRDAVTFTKFLKDNVVNFMRRNTRLTAQNALTNKKAQKKGEYKEPAARLIQAGGGDKTNLSCSGSTTSAGAKKIKTVTDILDGCEVAIKKACKPPDSINTTTLDTCKTNAEAFNKTVVSCISMATKGKDACSCFQADEVLKEKKVLEKCKGKNEAKAAAKARTACLKVIKECKNASTNAATLQYACSYSTDHLLKTLKQLTANSAAFKGLLDKIKELTGLSPQMPGDSSSRLARSDEENEGEAIFDSHQARQRGKRQQQACSTITTTITTCTTTISNKPASTEADKTAIQTALNDALDKNAIIIAFIASINAELKEVTGTTPKASDLTSSTAKASARSRSVLRKMIMEKMSFRN